MNSFVNEPMLVQLLVRRKIDFRTFHTTEGDYCIEVNTKERYYAFALNNHTMLIDLYYYVLKNYPLEDVQ